MSFKIDLQERLSFRGDGESVRLDGLLSLLASWIDGLDERVKEQSRRIKELNDELGMAHSRIKRLMQAMPISSDGAADLPWNKKPFATIADGRTRTASLRDLLEDRRHEAELPTRYELVSSILMILDHLEGK